MERLTTDKPEDNFQTMLNFVYGEDGWAKIRHDGENEGVLLTEWAKKQCILHGCDEFQTETYEEIDQEICDCMMDFPDCPVALAYCFASQAVHLRDRLKMYEDVLFDKDGDELLSLNDLKWIVSAPSDPLNPEKWEKCIEFFSHENPDRLIRKYGEFYDQAFDDACQAVVSVLRAQHDFLNRSMWEGCNECSSPCCASCGFDWVDDDEDPCCECAGGSEYEPKEYCSKCGRPLTEEAWAAMARRLKFEKAN